MIHIFSQQSSIVSEFLRELRDKDIQKVRAKFRNNIERIGQVEVHADQSRSAIVAQSMKHFMDIHWEHLQRGYRPKGQDMTFMSGSKFGNNFCIGMTLDQVELKVRFPI